MRLIHDPARDLAIEPRQADIEACPERIGALVEHEVDLRIDRTFPGELDLPLAGRDFHRAFEAGRPAGREQLLGIGTDAVAARRRQLDIQTAVGTARYPVLPPATGAGPGRVEQFCRLGHECLLAIAQLTSSGCRDTPVGTCEKL